MKIIIIIIASLLIGCPKNAHYQKPHIVHLKFEIAPELEGKEINITIYPRDK
jgi:hypothetical protein